ncbi:MAG TPA: indole-3-glycerol-phosphate synthase [Candidatus Diapherotrites archaeon]|uniref:indole-3-glycerol-phosphate synthase n=1 Tax=Candidatus Iainarchaeum sp. TaxID=3101447 RepID=A0A7J4JI99_9ARCH|nr:indole-3-glycerol-phosphate synthase [Candidatus Diapherotrites archaeon]HIH17064.1 indole-3-glycerol-phosphate synthase [Candidatus Diapherotrites archaeon]
MHLLDEILATKELEVKAMKKAAFRELPLPRGTFRLQEALARRGRLGLVAEFKRRSPAAGGPTTEAPDLPSAMQAYAQCADAVSVLVDQPFFGAQPDDLEQAVQRTPLPVLAKDFVLAKPQLDAFHFRGASATLLIGSILGKRHLQGLYAYSVELGLDALVEVHSAEELGVALDLNAQLIGVNNRDLRSFKVDLATTRRVLDSASPNDLRGKIIVSESGYSSLDDLHRAYADERVNAVLVGTSLMENPKLCFAFRRHFGGKT